MNLDRLNKEIIKKYNGKFKAVFLKGTGTGKNDESICLLGESNNWDEIIEVCSSAVDKSTPTRHVVNKITFTGNKIPAIHAPVIKDGYLDGEHPDVLIIGGGISGASIARELTRYKLDIILIEKESDLALGASGRNDGEVHPGVDLGKGSLKQMYVLKGNAMYEDVCKELGVPFRRNGQYVGFSEEKLLPVVKAYALQRRSIGVKDTKVISREELLAAQPNFNPEYKFGLYNSTAGTVCPYGITIAYAENAVTNGAKVSLNTIAESMDVANGHIYAVNTNRGKIYPSVVINAAGVYSDTIAEMADDLFFSIHPRRGTNSVLDKKASELTDGIISFKKLLGSSGAAHTKGGGIIRTVHDNILVGPDAVETYEKENYATTRESIVNVFEKQQKTSSKLAQKDIITSFTGVRAPTFEEDFIIERGRRTKNIFHCAGIQSPGLTTAPAVAKDVAAAVVEMLGGADKNEQFNPIRKPIPHLSEMTDEERDKLIKKNPDYGEIVCRCEEVSKGEILDALSSPICVPTVDGVKKRVRPGMGRCQGGFCSPSVTKIIAEFTEKNMESVTRNGNNAYILSGDTKAGENND